MKKFYLSLALILTVIAVSAQPPQKISYQAVVRDANQNLITNTGVGMRIQILQGSEFGAAVYVETHTPTANSNGLVTFEIGAGTVVNGDFSAIEWADGPYFIKTETDPTGGSSYSIVGTSELLSVPYALFSLNGTPGPEGPPGADGLDGEDGLSAYEIWLDLGNTGTEEEFIESLVGPAGVDGLDGEDGLSAYEIWLNLGNTGTEGDFIESLQGPAGQDGSAKDVKFAGYDLGAGMPVINSTAYTMWNSSGFGNTNVTVDASDKILVTVSAMVYKTGTSESNTISPEICPCYSETFTDPGIPGFAGRTYAVFQSTGSQSRHLISSSYLFTGLEGTYNFSLCLRRYGTVDILMSAPKVSVVVF
jgi:hypothetical protein